MFDRGDYLRYLGSPEWQAKRMACLKAYGWKCYICGTDFRERHDHLEVNHTVYSKNGRSILGHEDTKRDLVPLCSLHHEKGLMDWAKVKAARRRYQASGAVGAIEEAGRLILLGLVRLCLWLIRLASRRSSSKA